MNNEERKKLLSQSLAEAARKTAKADADKLTVERIGRDVKARLTDVHASDDDDLVCPACRYKGPESDFEPDDDDSDGFRTDNVTGATGNEDDVNEQDGTTAYDNAKELSPSAKSKVVAELLKNHRRNR